MAKPSRPQRDDKEPGNPLAAAVAHSIHLDEHNGGADGSGGDGNGSREPGDPGGPTDPDGPNGPRGPRRALRDPGGPGSSVLAWIVTLVALAVTVVAQWAGGPEAEPLDPSRDVQPPSALLQLSARYAVGSVDLTEAVSGAEDGDVLSEQLIEQIDSFATTPADRLRAAIVVGELRGGEAAIERIDRALKREADEIAEFRALQGEIDEALRLSAEVLAELDDGQTADAPGGTSDPMPPDAEDADAAEIEAVIEGREQRLETLRSDADLLRAVYTAGPDLLSDEERTTLEDRHGWFGRLALSYGLDDGAPPRDEALAKARRVAFVAVGGFALAGGVVLVGIVLGIIALVLALTGRIRPAYLPPAPGGSAYLEAFALFVVGFLAIGVVAGGIAQATGLDLSRWLVWLLPLAAVWPLIRGADPRAWRFALGLHTGRGVVREVLAGVVGYVACAPIFVVGVLLTLLLAAVVGMLSGGEDAPPVTHPIVEEAAGGIGLWTALGLYLLAAIWAPIAEELLFRGSLYHHLRGRLHALAGALAVGLVFAAVHPQGLIAIPALASLGVIFCLLREWRGSIIAPMTAHAMHNATLVTGLLLALG